MNFDLSFERGEYREARDIALRQLANETTTREAIAAFILADDQHRVKVLRELVSRSPSSLDARQALIQELIHQSRGDIAHRECCTGLATLSEPKAQLLLRRARLAAAFQSGKSDNIVEDIKLMTESELPGANRLLLGVIREIVAIEKPELRCSLALLADEDWIDEGLREVLVSKIAQLEYLEERKV